MLCLKANLLLAKILFPKVNFLLAKALLQKAALLDWSAPGLEIDAGPTLRNVGGHSVSSASLYGQLERSSIARVFSNLQKMGKMCANVALYGKKNFEPQLQ